MKKLFFLFLIFIIFSCTKTNRLTSSKTISFDIDNDVYIEGFSDAETPFLYYAASNDTIYKYYIDTKETQELSLMNLTGIVSFSRYAVVFDKEDFVLNQSPFVYNSKTNRLYNLDSLNVSNDKILFVLAGNNTHSWKNNELLINNWHYCDINEEQYSDKESRQLLCNDIAHRKPSFSKLNFETNLLDFSTINLNTIRPNSNFIFDLSSVQSMTTSIFANDIILYNNNYIDAVFEVDDKGNFQKVIAIQSKYTQFNKENRLMLRPGYEYYDRDYATRVEDLLYDEYRKKILIVLIHGTEDIMKYPEKKLTNRSFSILVYDSNYNFENEYFFNEKYNYQNVYVCKEGLIINANNKLSSDFKPRKLIYEVFPY